MEKETGRALSLQTRNDPPQRQPMMPDSVMTNLVWLRCKAWFEGTLQWADRFTAQKRWLLRTWLLCLAFTILVAGGIGFQSLKQGYQPGYYDKIEHPLKDLTKTYGNVGHDAKLNYRLTVPVVLHFLGIRNRWILPTLTALATAIIVLLSIQLAYRITASRVLALFLGLEVASTYIGSFGFLTCYDAIALAQVALACRPRLAWYLRGLLCFTASFTDERGLVASLFLFPLCMDFSRPGKGWRSLVNKDTLAIGGAILLYFILRFWMHFGLGMGSTLKGVGLGSFAQHVKHWHAGIWFGLEGGWVLVILAIVSLSLRRQLLRLAVFLLPIGGIVLGGLINGDLVRTTAYLFPAIFVALAILWEHESERSLVNYGLIAVVISVASGNYNVYLDEITWFMPLPVYLLNEDINCFVIWVKAMIGWRD